MLPPVSQTMKDGGVALGNAIAKCPTLRHLDLGAKLNATATVVYITSFEAHSASISSNMSAEA